MPWTTWGWAMISRWFSSLLSDKPERSDVEDAEGVDGPVEPRPVDQVIARALTLLIVARRATTGDRLTAIAELSRLKEVVDLTPSEKAFMMDETPSLQSCRDFSWRYEAIVPLLWSVNLLDTMGPIRGTVDTATLESVLLGSSFEQLIASAQPRPINLIEDAAEELMDALWAIRAGPIARLFPNAREKHPNASVVVERYYGLNWLRRWNDENKGWDGVWLDT